MFLVASSNYFFVVIAFLYQLEDFGPTFISNFNCLPINLNGMGNWFNIWHLCKTWKKSTKVVNSIHFHIVTLYNCDHYLFKPNIIHLNTKAIETHKFNNKSMEIKSFLQKMELQVRKFDMLVQMINFCKPKIEYEVQHNKNNETILKQFMHKSNDLHEEEACKWRGWEWYKLEEGTWSMDIEMEHFKVQQVHVNLIKKPQRIKKIHQNICK